MAHEEDNLFFKLKTRFKPAGDQPQAIKKIVTSFKEKKCKHHVLLGATGTGKTFSMANVIKELNYPTLIIAPNKTLAAQLYADFKNYFPESPVGFFISYYDYYQPEAYVPSTDTYITKDSSINDDIDKMRHEATRILFEEPKAIIISSVSCIYGLGSPQTYAKKLLKLSKGEKLTRDVFLKNLVDIQYTRNDHQIQRGSFRVRGDIIDILPAHKQEEGIRIEFFGDEVEAIYLINSSEGDILREIYSISLYPNSHYLTEQEDIKTITDQILEDLRVRLYFLKKQGKIIESQRLESRVLEDVEAFEQLGYCSGVENYSRYLSGKAEGEPPPTLLDYFPKDFLIIIDESHIAVPQISGMYRGDQARKKVLVDFGFRLPSALDNRPLNFSEFLDRSDKILYVSATPGKFELEESRGEITEQIIRPTGLVDPEIFVRKVENQIEDLYGEFVKAINTGGRVLVATLTKKMAEDLCEYYKDLGFRVRYLHSDIDALMRIELLNDLRKGKFDILVGINLLREGLDLPEVKLVAVLDADREGFLRSKTSLIQIIGRAARNHEGKVIFYAPKKTTHSMLEAIEETKRRRTLQIAYNEKHNIIPKTVIKEVPKDLNAFYGIINKDDVKQKKSLEEIRKKHNIKNIASAEKLITKKKKEMTKYATRLDFEKAAIVRDEIKEIKGLILLFGEKGES